MSASPLPSEEKARQYVHAGIHGKGGVAEAICGFRHKTLPTFLGKCGGAKMKSVMALGLRAVIVCVTALFPTIVRKLTTPSSAPVNTSTPFWEVLVSAVNTATSIDYFLWVGGICIVAAPKVLDALSKDDKSEHHTPFKDLTAAIRHIPIKSDVNQSEVNGAIRLTLLALREEMSLLIGAKNSDEVTDVALLGFCSDNGNQMQVLVRTANHEHVKRPNDSRRFVAYYVAREGRNFAEHDFKNSKNPFPAKRVSVPGNVNITYRSVLYMPVMVTFSADSDSDKYQPIDYCVGVICVHSSKPYRFWRWGDHKKGTGGFADVAFSRALPYIAIIEQLLSRTAPKVKVEVI